MLRFGLPLLILTLCAWASPPHSRAFVADEPAQIRAALLEAGLDSALVAGLRLDTLRCYPGALSINLHGRDAADYYRSFQAAETIASLRRWLAAEDSLLRAQERAYGLPPAIVGAILMIESRLGANWGRYRVPDLLLSLQLLAREATRGASLDSALARERRSGGERSAGELAGELERRAARRQAWAAREFRALTGLHPMADWGRLEGSWAGAMGIPQFLASSWAAYGADGDGDGRVDLYSMPDAIFSVGRYLRENGWRGEMDETRRRKALKRYNQSEHYVDAVLRLARDVGWGE
jgi:membrane-bound lytic murein transglycosylase B